MTDIFSLLGPALNYKLGQREMAQRANQFAEQLGLDRERLSTQTGLSRKEIDQQLMLARENQALERERMNKNLSGGILSSLMPAQGGQSLSGALDAFWRGIPGAAFGSSYDPTMYSIHPGRSSYTIY